MPIFTDTDDYLIGMLVDYGDYIDKLEDYRVQIKSLMGVKSKKRKRMFQRELRRVTVMKRKAQAISGPIYQELERVAKQINQNVMLRWREKLNVRTGSYLGAIEDSFRMGKIAKKRQFSAGIAFRPTLDEATDLEKGGYQPPQSYGDITGYWEFHEFTGSRGAQVFRSKETERFLGRGFGAFPRRNVILNRSNNLFPADRQEWATLTPNVRREIRRIWRSVK